jgi:hypothetical protein
MPASRARLVNPRLLQSIGFTNHAIERFAERAGLDTAERLRVEPIVRDLLVQEGRVVDRPPSWSRSRNEADRYLQVGEWLLLICRHDRRGGNRYDVVTIINNGNRMTWDKALDRGLIFTPPPLPARPRRRRPRARWTTSIAAGLHARRAADDHDRTGRLTAILRAHRGQRRALAAEHAAARAAHRALAQRHDADRKQAHERHLRRYKA